VTRCHSCTRTLSAAIVAILVAACAGANTTQSPKTSAAYSAVPTSPASLNIASGALTDPVLMGTGDICITSAIDKAAATAALVQARPNATVFTLGDNSNESGTAAQFEACFDKTWGTFKDRIHPTPGNHDYVTNGASGYYDYFGDAAGPNGKGYYSYDLPNNWHVVVLNAICSQVGGCERGSPQEQFLAADLEAHARAHVVAMWHIPAFSSGDAHGNNDDYRAFWEDLYAARAEIVLNGHDHDYERFAPQAPDGRADPNGIREFVVGTGGASQRSFGRIDDNSEVRHSGTFGVLALTLRAEGYDWQFIPVAGETFSDAGSQETHS
jgi:acid phosphatase type 7